MPEDTTNDLEKLRTKVLKKSVSYDLMTLNVI